MLALRFRSERTLGANGSASAWASTSVCRSIASLTAIEATIKSTVRLLCVAPIYSYTVACPSPGTVVTVITGINQSNNSIQLKNTKCMILAYKVHCAMGNVMVNAAARPQTIPIPFRQISRWQWQQKSFFLWSWLVSCERFSVYRCLDEIRCWLPPVARSPCQLFAYCSMAKTMLK